MPSDSSRPSIHRGRARATVSNRRPVSLVMWGVLLSAGGLFVWSLVPRRDDPVASIWTTEATSAGTASQMTSDVRTPGGDSSALLRLEWPEHPNAIEYRIRFRRDGVSESRPISVPSAVFLYDLESDVFRLPDEFEWSVASVLPDGSEIVSPWRRYSEP